MIKYIITFLTVICLASASVYDVGDFISTAHQNIDQSTCYAGNGYDVNDDWKLADWNGATNGGDYTVIFIDMTATWWPSCWTALQGPAGYEHQDYEDNDHVKFLTALSDLNQPYSCTQWGNAPDGGASQIIHDVGYDIWELFETGSAFPSTVFITHEMQVYDMMNNAGSWSIGSRMDQMLEDCGSLCEGDGGCSLTSGDVNEDELLNIQDIITMVNQILGSMSLMDCALEAADMNMDGVINIQDLISLVNTILGNARSAQEDGKANIEYITSGEDMLIQIDSEVEIAGIQLSFFNNSSVDIELKDNSHITQQSNYQDGIHRYLAYSIFNTPFDSKSPELLIKSAGGLNLDDIEIIVADLSGNALPLSKIQGQEIVHSSNFEISKLSPNPFNPSTQISFNLPLEGHVRLTAYDVRGQEADVIFEGTQSMGEHSYTWHASDLPSGLYYVRLQSGALVTTKKALLIK